MAARAAEAFADEIGRLDEIVDTANRLNLSADSLQKFHRAAVLASGDVESMNKALAVFQRTLGDAALGQSGPAKAFERLGLSAKLLSQVGLDQAFTAVLAKLGQIPNAAERASIAADLFGKSSANLTDLMANGSSALQQATNDLNQFGVSLNGRTEDIDKAQRAMERLKMSSQGLGTEAALLFSPSGALLAEGLAAQMSGLRNMNWRDFALKSSIGGSSSYHFFDEWTKGVLAGKTNTIFGTGGLADPSRFMSQASKPNYMNNMLNQSGWLDYGMARRSRSSNVPGSGPSTADAWGDVFNVMDFIQRREERSVTARGGVGAAEFGSLAAYQAVQASQRQDESLKLQRQELEEAKKTNKALDRVIENAIVLSELDLQG